MMQYSEYRSVSSIKNMMIIINFIIILFEASIILFSTKYVCNNLMGRDFLDTLAYLPKNPTKVFIYSIIGFALLVMIMFIRKSENFQVRNGRVICNGLEIILCFWIIYNLYMGYNGIALLVFADIIFNTKNGRNTMVIIGFILIIFLLSNYDIISNIIPMVSLDSYIQVYDAATKTAILIAKNILESTNLVLFIMFLIVYIANQIRENENISKELSMINEVNKQLKDYAAVTEKIGESNERKRLAREIHDTLGHALTGIAAGIDACIAMIDIDPNVTKQQLLVVSKVVREGISDVRRSLNKLRPGALEEHTLKEAIQKMIKEFSDVSEVEIMLDYQLDKVDFENTKEDIIFRIVQESITNALRHGRAKKVEINIYQRVSDLEIVIADNGVGCDDLELGYGLKQMQERAAILNGRLEYYSKEGFTVKVTIPMKEGERYD